MKEWCLRGIFEDKKKVFTFEEFDDFWSWSRLQLFTWGGEEFVTEYSPNDYERVGMFACAIGRYIL